MLKHLKRIVGMISAKPRELQLVPGSQEYVLATRMHQAGLRHNDKVLADLNDVTVQEVYDTNGSPFKPKMYFCGLREVVVKERIAEGDGERISDTLRVDLTNIKAPTAPITKKSQKYALKNVLICANGKITIEATPQSKWVKV